MPVGTEKVEDTVVDEEGRPILPLYRGHLLPGLAVIARSKNLRHAASQVRAARTELIMRRHEVAVREDGQTGRANEDPRRLSAMVHHHARYPIGKGKCWGLLIGIDRPTGTKGEKACAYHYYGTSHDAHSRNACTITKVPQLQRR